MNMKSGFSRAAARTVLALAILITASARAEDPECPTVVHPDYALATKALPTRVMAYAVGYGILYLRYGFQYLAATVGEAATPSRTDLYQRPDVIEARSFCPGSDVLLDGVPGRVVGAVGPQFPRDPDLRSVMQVPADATNYLTEGGTFVEVAIANVHEIASVDRVAVADSALYLPALTNEDGDGVVRPGEIVSDCRERIGRFRRVFARPGQFIRNPGEQIVEFGTPGKPGALVALKNVCIELPSSRQIEVGVRGSSSPVKQRARLIGYRGFDSVSVEFADGTSKVVPRTHIIKP